MDAPYPPLSPAFAVNDAAKAIEFYKAAFGAEERYRLIDPENGKVGHAELTIHGALIMLSDEYPAFNKAPTTLGGTTVRLCLMSENVDSDFNRAIKAGATVVRPPTDEFYGHRDCCVADPFGHQWMITQEIEKIAPEEMQSRWNKMAVGRKAK